MIARLILFIVLVSGCVQSDPDIPVDELLEKINNSLEQGKAVVVYRMLNADKNSEQYADWAAYLNDFSVSRVSEYDFYEANTFLDAYLLKNQFAANDSYTLFVKGSTPVYFYEGVIVEPVVYLAVDAVFNKRPLTAMHQAFLPEAIEIKLK